MAHNILLEAGTNEIELLTFYLDGTPFGVNVAKVREIIERPKIIQLPHAHESVEGSFKLRDSVLTLLNLGKYFDMEGDTTRDGKGQIIIVEYNAFQCGILVDEVREIKRLSWTDIEAPSPYLQNKNVPITGTTNFDDKTYLIVDFETLTDKILNVPSPNLPEIPEPEDISPKDARIFIVDDSTVVRKSLQNYLEKSGYHNVSVYSNGKAAWDALLKSKEDEHGPCDIVLSDIEMPHMDGLRLTRNIKEDPTLKHIPVILISSIATAGNQNKGKSVGADAQIQKSDGYKIAETVDEFTAKLLKA